MTKFERYLEEFFFQNTGILLEKIKIDQVTKDLLGQIGDFLTDKVNCSLPQSAYDDHQRLIYKQSFPTQAGLGEIPVVNQLVGKIVRHLKLKSKPPWPKGKKYAIGLSHDVDIIDQNSILEIPFACQKKLFYNLVILLQKTKALVWQTFNNNQQALLLFKKVIDEEKKYGFRSTFFFASVFRTESYASLVDVAYDISLPKFQLVFEEIKKHQFEIGLHASYNAYENTKNFLFEKEKLEKITGVKIKGLRHHFWHMGKTSLSTLQMHQKAGFEYDSSIAFEEEMGFRRSVAWPYFPWDQVNQKPIKTLQLPVFCMDGNLFYNPMEVKKAVAKAKKFIHTIKKYHGLGVIDWHLHTSYPCKGKYQSWGEGYLGILKLLAQDPQAWVTNLGEINDWIRRKKKTNIDNFEGQCNYIDQFLPTSLD